MSDVVLRAKEVDDARKRADAEVMAAAAAGTWGARTFGRGEGLAGGMGLDPAGLEPVGQGPGPRLERGAGGASGGSESWAPGGLNPASSGMESCNSESWGATHPRAHPSSPQEARRHTNSIKTHEVNPIFWTLDPKP